MIRPPEKTLLCHASRVLASEGMPPDVQAAFLSSV
jgi:hypothetical protein